MPEIHLREIDDSNRADHYRLTAADTCYFLYEYTAGAGFRHSDTNQLISNLKKKPSESWKNGYHYKAQAIMKAAAALGEALNPRWLDGGTIVPVPSSKAADHQDYDDRLRRICRAIRTPPPDVRELIVNVASHEASHESANRPTVEQLLQGYRFDQDLADSKPVTSIGIFDDMLTVGTHFRAMQIMLSAKFPDARIFGIFLTRRALPKAADEFQDLDV